MLAVKQLQKVSHKNRNKKKKAAFPENSVEEIKHNTKIISFTQKKKGKKGTTEQQRIEGINVW